MSGIDNQIEYWDRAASEKTFSHPLNLSKFSALVSFDQRILDYGCGYGRTCNELFNLGFKNVLGVDSSPQMIERGRKEHPHLNLQVLSHPYLEFADEAFDAIILFSVLTCIPTDEGQRRIMAEVSRLLCPGGVLSISDLPLQVDERNRGRYQKFAEKFGLYGVFELPDGAICRHHEMSWIGSLTSGLEAIETTEVEVVTMNGHAARAFQYLGRKLRRL